MRHKLVMHSALQFVSSSICTCTSFNTAVFCCRTLMVSYQWKNSVKVPSLTHQLYRHYHCMMAWYEVHVLLASSSPIMSSIIKNNRLLSDHKANRSKMFLVLSEQIKTNSSECRLITAPLNNMRTIKLMIVTQPTVGIIT